MKNVEEVFPKRPVFKVRLQGAPLPVGWAVRYKSGMEEKCGIRSGEWLSQWSVDKEAVTFNFSHDRNDMVIFDHDADALKIVQWFHNQEVETEALKVG
jgi:hypothetical protein